MLLSTQLKRGYIALIGIPMIAASLAAAPADMSEEYYFVQKTLLLKECNATRQARWKLASTPFDIPALPSYKIRLCQS